MRALQHGRYCALHRQLRGASFAASIDGLDDARPRIATLCVSREARHCTPV